MRSVLVIIALAGAARAEPLDAITRDRLEASLPPGLGVARVHLPAKLDGVDLDPGAVIVEIPRVLHAGRPSIKLIVRGNQPVWVPVTISAMSTVAVAQRALQPGEVIAARDITVEQRAVEGPPIAAAASVIGATATHAIAAGALVGARDVERPPPLARGTQVRIEVRRGAVHVRGTGTLELDARPGDPATARLATTRTLVRGVLIPPATLIVGDPP